MVEIFQASADISGLLTASNDGEAIAALASLGLVAGREYILVSDTEPDVGDRFNGMKWEETSSGSPLYPWYWVWDSGLSKWLSSNTQVAGSTSPFTISSETFFGGTFIDYESLDLYLMSASFRQRFDSGTPTNDASNYWTFSVESAFSTNIATANTISSSPSAFTPFLENIELDHLQVNANISQLQIKYAKTGSVTNISRASASIFYRFARP